MKKWIGFCVASLALTACGTPIYNTANQGISNAERHPITIDQQTVSMIVPVDPTRNGLNRAELADLDAFVTTYRRRGHGPITVTAPSGTNSDLEAAQTAAEVRAALNSYGIDYRDLQGSTYRSQGQPKEVVVSFVRYVATASECGVWTGELSSRFRNMSHPNFGCADQNNLAAMVADPRDLTRTPELDPIDGASAAHPVRAARAPEARVNEIGVVDAVK